MDQFNQQVALPWVARLRWIAVVGQIVATALACLWLRLPLHLFPIALLIAITAGSNLLIQFAGRRISASRWAVPTVIIADVLLFTLLLCMTGGGANPFCILYAVHVAMAVVVLGSGWALFVVGLSAACYAAVFFVSEPIVLSPRVSATVLDFGQWSSLLLVMFLIAYFIGRVMRSLSGREAELIAARERARRGEHLASLTTLAAGAAHELGTPLSTIALVAKEMERGEDPAALVEDARLIRQQVDRCRQILDRMRVDVLDDAAQRPSSATPGELLEELRSDLRPSERERLRVEFTNDNAPLLRSRVLRRVLGVLLRNAFDASPADAAVHLLFQRRDDRIIFEVLDGGAGMPEDVRRRAGEPFFTTKPPGEGMGLGLFLVRLAAETYDGQFELQSNVGLGTRSTFSLRETRSNGSEHELAGHEAEDDRRRRRRDLSQASDAGALQPRI